eukprot:Skav235916  [mRNA]  locus=scaffold3781:69540:72352:+ [translate_table: standard]
MTAEGQDGHVNRNDFAPSTVPMAGRLVLHYKERIAERKSQLHGAAGDARLLELQSGLQEAGSARGGGELTLGSSAGCEHGRAMARSP